MVRERDLALTLSDDAVLDEPCERGREGAVRYSQTASQLLARHAGAQRMGGVIRAELFASALGEGVPVLGRPDPPGDAFRRELVDGLGSRRMKRSPDAAAVGASRYSCTQPSEPASMTSPPSTMARAPTSTVPVCSVRSAPWRSGRGESASTRTRASTLLVAGSVSGRASTSPRLIASRSAPVRLA